MNTQDIRDKLAMEFGWRWVEVHDPFGSHWQSPDGLPRPHPFTESALGYAVDAIGRFDFTLQRRGEQYTCTIFQCVEPMGDDIVEYGTTAAEAVYLAVGKLKRWI